MKMLNSIGSIISLWDTLLVTGIQLDFMQISRWQPFEPNVSASFQSTSLSIHLVPASSVCGDVMGDSVKILAPGKINNILFFPHTKSVILSQKAVRLVMCKVLFLNLC